MDEATEIRRHTQPRKKDLIVVQIFLFTARPNWKTIR